MSETRHPQVFAAGSEPRHFFGLFQSAVSLEAADLPLLAIIFVVPMLPTMAKGLALRIIVLEVLALASLLLLPLGKGKYHWKLRSKATPLDRIFLLWMLFVFLGVFLGANTEYALYKTGYILSLLVLFYCFTTRITNFQKALVFMTAAMLSALFASVLELVFSSGLGRAIFGTEISQNTLGSILYIHPYLAAQYLLPVCLMTLAVTVNRGPLLIRGLAALLTVPVLIYLFIIGSRGTYIAFLATGGFLLVLVALRFSERKGLARLGRGIWFALPIVLVGMAVIFVLLAAGLLGTPGLKAAERVVLLFNPDLAGFNFSRILIWKDALRMSGDSLLLGFGQGNFSMVFPAYHMEIKDIPHAHNQFIQILCENGTLGVLCFAAVMVQLFLLIRRGRGNPFTDDLGFSLRAGASCALAATGIYCFFETPLEWPTTATFLLLPISILLIPIPGVNQEESRLRSRWPWFVLAPLALLLWIGPGISMKRAVLSGIQGDRGMRLMGEQRFEESADAFGEAAAAWSCRPKIYFWWAHALLQCGRMEEAYQAAKRSLEIQPGVAVAHAICGHCLFRMGRYTEAKDHLIDSLAEGNPLRSHTTYFFLGKTYRRIGSLEAALKVYRDLYDAGYHCSPGSDLFFEMSKTLIDLERQPSLIIELLFQAKENSSDSERDLMEIKKLAALVEERFPLEGDLQKQLRKLNRQIDNLLEEENRNSE